MAGWFVLRAKPRRAASCYVAQPLCCASIISQKAVIIGSPERYHHVQESEICFGVDYYRRDHRYNCHVSEKGRRYAHGN